MVIMTMKIIIRKKQQMMIMMTMTNINETDDINRK